MNIEPPIRHEIATPKWWICWFCALMILITGGWAYRHYAPAWQGTGQTIIHLPVPLSDFPNHIGNWTGRDEPLPSTTESYMRQNFADDFFTKRYINTAQHMWASLYVVYCASRPAAIRGHRPDVCYINSGWIQDGTEPSQFTTLTGLKVPCLIHRYHKPPPDYTGVVVINFYIVNGRLTNSEDDLTRMVGRTPNTQGDPAKYVAQVEISSFLESDVRAAAADLVDRVLYYLPDETGFVHADPNEISTPTAP